MQKKKNKGFTLIELLVVIAIIGILAAIGLSALTSARAKARDAKRKSDLREVSTAVELYYADHGRYPDSTASPSVSSFSTLITYLKANSYLSKDIADPLTPSRQYCYGVSESPATMQGLYYRMGAQLEVTSDTSMQNDGGVSNTLYEVGNALGNSSGNVTGCTY